MNAAAVRKNVLALRKALSPEDLRTKSACVVSRLLQLVPASRWNHLKLALYRASLPGELALDELQQRLARSGARLFFPRAVERSLEFVELQPGLEDWRRGSHGVWEPRPELAASDASTLDAVIVPGVAFGTRGERIGMGVGHYDRFLARIDRPLRIVLAFDFQLFDQLEQNPWDQPVDWIITETHDIRNDRAHGWLKQVGKK